MELATTTATAPLSTIKEFLAAPQKLLIDGKRVDAANGETFAVLDPSDNIVLTRASKGEKEDIDRAVKAARNAFENGPWRKIKTVYLPTLLPVMMGIEQSFIKPRKVCWPKALLLAGCTPSAGDAYFEAGAHARFTFDFDFTFMRFGDVFADTEPQPTTPFIL